MFGHSSGKRGRLSKADLDTGWSTEDERQCSLCQKYGDLKPNVSEGAVGVCKYNTIFFFFHCITPRFTFVHRKQEGCCSWARMSGHTSTVVCGPQRCLKRIMARCYMCTVLSQEGA